MIRSVRHFSAAPIIAVVSLAAGIVGMDAASVKAVAPGDEIWVAEYDSGLFDAAVDSEVSPDGQRIFVAGSTTSIEGNTIDFLTIAISASDGSLIWTARFQPPALGDATPVGIEVSPDGTRVFVAGSFRSFFGSVASYVTLAYDAETGQGIWVNRYQDPLGASSEPYAMTVSPDGGLVVVTGDTDLARSFGTVAYDADTGALAWSASFATMPRGHATSIAIDPLGSRLFVTGSRSSSTTGEDLVIVAYDAATGTQVWDRVSRFVLDDWGSDVAVSPHADRVFLAGGGGTSPDIDYLTAAITASTGKIRWARRYGNPAQDDDSARAIAVSPDGGGVFVTGTSYLDTGWTDIATVGYEAGTGTELWTAQFDGSSGFADFALDLVVNPLGGEAYVVGSSNEPNHVYYDFVTVAYSTVDGALLWSARYGASGQQDYGISASSSPDGMHVYVTGTSQDNLVTVAYQAQ